MQVIVRHATPEDRAFILATWLRGAYYDITESIKPNKDQYFKAQSERIKDLLSSPTVDVRIAGDMNDLLWIAGYSVTEGPDLHWAYVRADFRRKGIANLLTKDLGITHVRSLTKLGLQIAQKKSLIFTSLQGEQHGYGNQDRETIGTKETIEKNSQGSV